MDISTAVISHHHHVDELTPIKKEFLPFPRLPIELRSKIWQAAIADCDGELADIMAVGWLPKPLLATVNKEAWDRVQEACINIMVDDPKGEMMEMMVFVKAVWLRPQFPFREGDREGWRNTVSAISRDSSNVKRVALNAEDWIFAMSRQDGFSGHNRFWRMLKNVEEIAVVVAATCRVITPSRKLYPTGRGERLVTPHVDVHEYSRLHEKVPSTRYDWDEMGVLWSLLLEERWQNAPEVRFYELVASPSSATDYDQVLVTFGGLSVWNPREWVVW